ncbi:MAG: hypothetical protein AAF492_01010 [Verrucomicrobiota bacterium]
MIVGLRCALLLGLAGIVSAGETLPEAPVPGVRLDSSHVHHVFDGLAMRLLGPVGLVKPGSSIPVVAILENRGNPKTDDGSIWVSPVFIVGVSRNDWYKGAYVRLYPKPKSKVHLEKGQSLYGSVNFAELFEFDMTGRYFLHAGYDGEVIDVAPGPGRRFNYTHRSSGYGRLFIGHDPHDMAPKKPPPHVLRTDR